MMQPVAVSCGTLVSVSRRAGSRPVRQYSINSDYEENAVVIANLDGDSISRNVQEITYANLPIKGTSWTTNQFPEPRTNHLDYDARTQFPPVEGFRNQSHLQSPYSTQQQRTTQSRFTSLPRHCNSIQGAIQREPPSGSKDSTSSLQYLPVEPTSRPPRPPSIHAEPPRPRRHLSGTRDVPSDDSCEIYGAAGLFGPPTTRINPQVTGERELRGSAASASVPSATTSIRSRSAAAHLGTQTRATATSTGSCRRFLPKSTGDLRGRHPHPTPSRPMGPSTRAPVAGPLQVTSISGLYQNPANLHCGNVHPLFIPLTPSTQDAFEERPRVPTTSWTLRSGPRGLRRCNDVEFYGGFHDVAPRQVAARPSNAEELLMY
ncbi:hypothetical protein L596_030099 [Steinernema carpocapsae]|uniref:Uncharacterized protein n=1 Tax=Steinernema carpocapsae TaxID=34508 RepID=A0A4U5LRR4_STECR|nr:hypothetical protein L596_030099 [Steinernema carpocapsae]